MKRKLIGKILLGSIVSMLMVMFLAMNAFADEQRPDIQNVTKTVSTICDAKALVNELKAKGITCNLTINCASQEQIDYLKAELVSVPMATIYRPVQLCLKKDNSSSSNCTTVTTNQNQTNNNCNTNTQNNNTSQNNNCDKKDTTCSKTDNTCNKNNNSCIKTDNSCNKNDNNCNKTNTTEETTENTCNKSNADTNASNSCNSANEARDASPKTGDSFGIRMIICLAIASLMTMVTVYVKKRRSNI